MIVIQNKENIISHKYNLYGCMNLNDFCKIN